MTPSEAATAHVAPLLEMRDIDKSFPGVHALKAVDLTLHAGEVLALLGENGAGKSTLIKVLSGAHSHDSGEILIDGQDPQIRTPLDARRAGVAVMYQEFNLVPSLSASENIFLGRELTTAGFVQRGDENNQAQEILERLGVDIDPDTPCRDLTVAQMQVVEIAKALSLDARILVMDEPSAALTTQEVDRLFEIVVELKAQGIGVIYISHRLAEIFTVADRVMIMRDGSLVQTRPITDVTRSGLIESMVGRALDSEFPKRRAEIREDRLVVRNLRHGASVRDVSFTVRGGEVLGVTGLVGAGRTEVARLIFGADRREGGTIELDGRPLSITNPRTAIRNGICLLTEDRKSEGLLLGRSVLENFGLPNLARFSRFGVMKHRDESDAFAKFVRSLSVKIPNLHFIARNLSGGNQQKLVLAKWLQRNCEVIIFDEPTRGIDVGSKYEIYLLINSLVTQGKAVIMISSELPEVLGMSDRILVMHEGRVTGEITDVENATQKMVMELAIG